MANSSQGAVIYVVVSPPPAELCEIELGPDRACKMRARVGLGLGSGWARAKYCGLRLFAGLGAYLVKFV
jgi:hypothetical protein